MSNIIFTDHALKRLDQRHFTKNMVITTINHPDKTNFGKKDGTKKFTKRFANQIVTAITSTNDKGEIIVISTWIDPPFGGTKDARKKARYLLRKKSGFLKGIWLTFLDMWDGN